MREQATDERPPVFASRARARNWLLCSWLYLAGFGVALPLLASGRRQVGLLVVFLTVVAAGLAQLLGRPRPVRPWWLSHWQQAHDAARELGLPANLLAAAYLVVLVALVAAGITLFVWM